MKKRFLVLIVLVTALPVASAQDLELPNDPLDGRILFEARGCIDCHSVGGYGGTSGPDLSRDLYFGSFLGLVASIWNHIPDMNRQYRLRRIRRPTFSEKEILDLASFIFYLRYLGEPGSVARGRTLLTEKRCVTCHGINTAGPDLPVLAADGSPLRMVQAMWNHGPAMQDRLDELGIPYPVLEGRDVSDISSYLGMVAARDVNTNTATGNPVRGRVLLAEKHCDRCHSATGNGQRVGPALDEMDLRKSVVEIAALMWNHGPDMRVFMAEEGIEWPHFDGREMADVIAYLYFIGFQDQDGDPVAGRTMFEDKGCATCHQPGDDSLGPDLGSVRSIDRPARLAQLLWNHADEMEDLMLARNARWPTLEERDLQNLLAYLKSIKDGK